MIDGLLLLLANDTALLALLAGTGIGLVFGILPGVSGRTGLIVMAPLMIGVEPLMGAVFLLALHAVVHTSGSIPAILVGVPTSASEAATVLDGHALTRRGRAGLAIGVTLAASAVGGVLGAAALLAMMQVFRPVIAHVGQPEILMLSLVGLAMVASLSDGRVAAGIATAALGVLAGCVGMDAATGTPRFVADALELWDGLDIPVLVTGLFVVPELMSRAQLQPLAADRGHPPRWRDTVLGMQATLRRWGLLLRASLIGIVVGVIPGMGASIAVWLAYGHAAQTEKSQVPYGRGAIAGVLAPEAANNAKEGGALAPTLFLGIPGSSGMAIMIAAFAAMGLRPGANFLTTDAAFTGALAWTIALANLIAVPLCLLAAPLMAGFAVRTHRVMPVLAVCAASVSALYASPYASTLVQLAVFSLIGCALRAGNWPRPPFVLGFVVGPTIEGALQKTIAIHGWEMLSRPGTVLLGLVVVATLWFAARRGGGTAQRGAATWETAIAATAIALGIAAAWHARSFPLAAWLLPVTSGATLALAAAIALMERQAARRRVIRGPQLGASGMPAGTAIAAMSLFLATSAVAGLPLATAAFVGLWLARCVAMSATRASAVAMLAAATVALTCVIGGARPLLTYGLFAG
jgi:putative tricarboxylic transport membrane protein